MFGNILKNQEDTTGQITELKVPDNNNENLGGGMFSKIGSIFKGEQEEETVS